MSGRGVLAVLAKGILCTISLDRGAVCESVLFNHTLNIIWVRLARNMPRQFLPLAVGATAADLAPQHISLLC